MSDSQWTDAFVEEQRRRLRAERATRWAVWIISGLAATLAGWLAWRL